MDLSRIFCLPVAKILLANTATQMEMSFFTCYQNNIFWDFLKDIVTTRFAVFLVSFTEFLHDHHFVGEKFKVCV